MHAAPSTNWPPFAGSSKPIVEHVRGCAARVFQNIYEKSVSCLP
jgi:hypothetical protein